MQKGTKTLLWVVGLAAAGYGTWWMVKNLHVTPRQKSIVKIVGERYNAFETAFLKAWGEASEANQATFVYNSKTYDTTTGRVAK